MRRRQFVELVGGGAAAWTLGAHAQQRSVPTIGYLDSSSPEARLDLLIALRQGLKEGGYIEGDNVFVEYRWAEDRIERLPARASEFIQQSVRKIRDFAATQERGNHQASVSCPCLTARSALSSTRATRSAASGSSAFTSRNRSSPGACSVMICCSPVPFGPSTA